MEVCSVAVELEEPVRSVGALEESLLVLEGAEVRMVCYPRQP